MILRAPVNFTISEGKEKCNYKYNVVANFVDFLQIRHS